MPSKLRSTLIVVLTLLSGSAGAEELHRYRVVLSSPGGRLPFLLSVTQRDGVFVGTVHNGAAQIELPNMVVTAERLVIPIPHYDSSITLTRVAADPGPNLPAVMMRGTWRKRSAKDAWSEMPAQLEPVTAKFPGRFLRSGEVRAADVARIAGRWRIAFSSSSEPAVGQWTAAADGTVTGTIMTSTGDYGFLAGRIEAGRLRLSNFDGAHAFLFDARLQGDGTLAGDFWSRDTWHETWTATRDTTVELADPYGLTRWNDTVDLGKLRFRDLDGKQRSLAEPALRGKARIIEVFGSWCPNCYDASRYLGDVDRRFRDLGLQTIGLAFELTGDFDRDAAQVRKFVERCDVDYPVLVAGMRGRDEVAAALPMMEEFKAYPTTIVLSGDDRVVAIHAGFSGPATGAAYIEHQQRFETLIRQLLRD